ncbi:MAG: 16S rRNA (guanine(966)-N(2))-methyltransferase RsmD [bacterium]|nr:16S rRNA (guanine(966)-N(2))-methyltransferase RsmD [bacterium]
MRIVGGEFKGTRLQAPKGKGTRPTSDRVRESLFNLLAHSFEGFSIEGARVLDLFAGTGALGLEAISRGAAMALFVENDPDARGAQRDNVDALGLIGRTRLFRRDAAKLGKAGNMGQFNLVFLDPPYGKGLAEKALIGAREGDWLQDGALIVIEEKTEAEIALPTGFVKLDERIYGSTRLVFLQVAG